MQSTLLQFLEALLGAPLGTFAALLLLWTLRKMAEHAVLLHGSVQPDPADPDDRNRVFRFHLQNLEEVPVERPFRVRLLGHALYTSCPAATPAGQAATPAGPAAAQADPVEIYAGPKQVLVDQHAEPRSDAERLCPLNWCAMFEVLPPYDTLMFVVRGPFTRVEMQLEFEGEQEEGVLRRGLRPGFTETRLELSRKTPAGRVKGADATPGYPIFALISLAASAAFLSASYLWIGRDYSFAEGKVDLAVLGGMLLLMWVVFSTVRRPVYPVIQGYREKTCPVPKAPSPTVAKVSN